MAGKMMELALAIKGQIDKSLPDSVKKAIRDTEQLREKLQSLKKIDTNAQKLKELSDKVQESNEKMTLAKASVSAVRNEYNASKNATEQYKVKLEEARIATELMKRTATPQEYARAREEVLRLSMAYKNSSTATKSLAKDLAAANREAEKAAGDYARVQAKANRLGAELRQAGFDTDRFAESQNRLQKELAQTEKALAAAKKKTAEYDAEQKNKASFMEAHKDKQERMYTAMGNVQSGVLAIQSFAAPIMETVEAAMKFESVMADVRKVVDFDTPTQFKEMSDDILKLSTQLPMAAEDIAKIVAAGGQSGIARDDLMSFAESATKMGIAFDITADQAGEMMAKWRTAFKLGQNDVVALADKINYLGNTTAASAPLISDVVTRIGPLGEIGGVASGEIAALGASMVGSGVQSEVAATGIKNFILALTKGESVTKSQCAAYKSLGLNYMKVAEGMQTNSRETIMTVLKSIQALDKVEQASVMNDLFGSESLGAIAPLLSNLDALENNFNKVADATQYAGSMQAEYDARSQTTENQLTLAKNTLNALSINIGSALLPAINSIMTAIAPVAETFAAFAGENQGLIVLLVGLAAAVAGVVMACLAVNAAVAAWGMVSSTLTMVRGVIGGVSAAQGVLNAVMALNPFVIVALAVIALVGALVYLWNTNEGFREAVLSAWESLKSGAMDIFTGIADFLSGVWTAITEKAAAAWTAVAPAFEAAWSVISTIAKAVFVVVALVVLTAMEIIVGFIKLGVEAGMAVWALIAPYVQGIWNTICSAVNVGVAIINAVMQACGAFVSAVWDLILSAAETVWNGVLGVVGMVWAMIEPIVSAGAAFIMALWNEIYSTASSTWNAIVEVVSSVWSQVQSIVDAGVAVVEEKWNHLKEIFSSPIQAVVNFVKGGSSEAQSAASDATAKAGMSATGGIFSHPYLTWVAEAGDTEVIVPINRTSNALKLWQAAGRMLGVYHPAAKLQTNANKTSSNAVNMQSYTAGARSFFGSQLQTNANKTSSNAVNMQSYTAGARSLFGSQLQKNVSRTSSNAVNMQSYTAAARNVAGAQMSNIEDIRLSKESFANSGGNTSVAMPSAPNTSMSVDFAPVINISGSPGGSAEDVAALVRKALEEQQERFARELPRMLANLRSRERRLSYA